MEIELTELPLHSANSVIVILYVVQTFMTMCGKYAKTKSKILKLYIKEHVLFFFILNRKSLDIKPLLEKANPTLIASFFLDNPHPLIKNVYVY